MALKTWLFETVTIIDEFESTMADEVIDKNETFPLEIALKVFTGVIRIS